MKVHKSILRRHINCHAHPFKNEANASKKLESFESNLNVDSARAAANRIAQQFGRMISAAVRPDDYGNNVVYSPMYGWLTISAVNEIAEDKDARFGFHYTLDDGKYSIEVYPTDNTVNLINKDWHSVDPTGRPLSSNEVAYPFSKWKGFDLSMVHYENGRLAAI